MGTGAPLSDISPDKLVSFETAVYPVPQYDPDNIKMISQGPSICIFNKEDPQVVLASWLFAQYMLTGDVQIPYSETEGYVPVTKTAGESEEYREYLSAEGTDEAHYEVKIKAVKMLLAHTEDTFITPVFNGSASVRDAAGQLIENVVKSVRRRETVDDAYIEKLYSDVSALYRLEALKTSARGSSESGDMALPAESKTLLSVLAVSWIILGGIFVCRKKKGL